MIYVDAPFKKNNTEYKIYNDRHQYDNDDLIKITNKNITRTEDWGDEDVMKVVSDIDECDITIDASIAADFEGVNKISFLRWNYYKPAYDISGKSTTTRIDNPDGSITYQVRR